MPCARFVPALLFVSFFAPTLAQAQADPAALPAVAVVTGPAADDLESYATEQLCEYLSKLYAIKVQPTPTLPASADVGLLVGSPETNPAVRAALGTAGWPRVSEQGLVLKPARLQGKPVLIVGGGSPRATMWAAFELVERWGVRYLLHGDVLPEDPGPFRLPESEVTLEPALTVRQWRVVNEHAMGPVSWGLADYRPVLDQLAKLKFNRLFAYIWPLQPFVHYEAGGIKRRSAELFFGFHYPVTGDMPGRKLFGEQLEFWNPDFPRNASYQEMRIAGEQHLHGLMQHAHKRGMECMTVANLGEFPTEFEPLLKNAQKTIGVGTPTLVPGADSDPTDPALTELCTAVLQATINTYPELDFIELGMQEFRQWAGRYEQAWRALDRKYGIEKNRPLAEVLAAAAARTSYPGGAARAVQEVKGDIVVLYFYDRLLTDLEALKGTRRPKLRVVFDSIAEELFPILPRLLPPGSETLNHVDYTASRIVKRRAVLKDLPARKVPSTLIFTLHDDNVGVLPQLATPSLHELVGDLRRHGWAGFSSRYWLIGDHDPCVAYLSRAAWDDSTTPELVYRDQVRSACGAASVDDLLLVFREVEKATLGLEDHGLGLTFPVPNMLLQHWRPDPFAAELAADRSAYQRALDAARRALTQTIPAGKPYIDYWIGRLEFGIGYLDTIEQLHAAAAESEKKPAEAARLAETALATFRNALEAFARVARDQSDRGTLATLAELAYRPLRDKVAALKKGGVEESIPGEQSPRGESKTIETAPQRRGWKPHVVRMGDGHGGWIAQPAELQFLRKPGDMTEMTMCYGLAQMDNGEIILTVALNKEDENGRTLAPNQPLVAFSRNRGNTWSDFAAVPDAVGRPVMLTYLGKGNLTFQTDVADPTMQFFSKDYGRTWKERQRLQPSANRGTHVDGRSQPGFWGAEGNNLVDRDAHGVATRIAQVGWNYDPGKGHPAAPANSFIRWSADGGRTWTNESRPAVWPIDIEHDGRKFVRGISEGSLERAANGWLVAALRTDMHPRYLGEGVDNLEGTGVSISRDDGTTWSPVKVLFEAGRMHAHLLRLPGGELVMTVIVRIDMGDDGRLASYRRGCEAVVSRDNGLTWDLSRRYVLDDFESPGFLGRWSFGPCGHLCTALLDDGSLLTGYSNYRDRSACLVRWRLAGN
jgi:hypothetical protein